MKKIIASLLICFSAVAIKAQPFTSAPFVLQGEHMTIQLNVNGKDSLLFIFDTGASTTVIDSAAAVAIALKEVSKTTIAGAGGNASHAICSVDSITFKNFRLLNITAVKASLASLSRSMGTTIHGIIGADILRRYITAIDYDASTIRLYKDKNTIDFSIPATSIPLDFSLGLSIPSVPLTILLKDGTNITGDFLLDNGAGITACINTPHVNDLQLLQKAGKVVKSTNKGLNSKSGNYLAAAQSISFAGYSFSDIPFILEQSAQGVVSMRIVKGLLGNVILKRFNILLDYAAKKMYIQPNNLFNSDFKFPMTGFKLEQVNKELVVADINEESEAAKNGLQNGYILLSIDDQQNLSLKEARELLSKPGIRRLIFLDEKKQSRTITLKLERLI